MSRVTVTGDGSVSLFNRMPDIFLAASCGGKGTCGRCRVKIDGIGTVLACEYFPLGECSFELVDTVSPDSFSVVSLYDVPSYTGSSLEGYGIAIDIGTTTLALELVNLASGAIISRSSALNSQRRFGLDVLSRIRAEVEGHGSELMAAIKNDITNSINQLLSSSNLSTVEVHSLSIAGNTTMIHLLLGLSCETLGVSPFVPVSTSFPEYQCSELFPDVDLPNGIVKIVPSISAFIGGDIVSGLASLSLGFENDSCLHTHEPVLFVDLGTNAEIVLIKDGHCWCTSAAAGPAFEGGNISCGCGSISGAVSSVWQEKNRFAYTVIGKPDTAITGLCGSGLLDFVACALNFGLIRKDGSLSPVCENSGVLLDSRGTISLNAKDIREVQLAKAAIRAGIAVLLSVAGVDEKEVSRVHLAGGFGYYLKESSAIDVGLLPQAFKGKIHSCGNTSLAGCVHYLRDASMNNTFNRIRENAHVIQLADEVSFNKIFIESMEF